MSHESKSFTWTSPGGVAVTLPSMKSIKGGVIRRNRKLEPVDFMFSVLEETADEATLAQIDDLDTSDMNALFEAWQEDAQTNVGESSGSSI
jgi:hypothetical protein